MQTAPAEWGYFRDRLIVAPSGMIIKITKGDSVWHFCHEDAPLKLTDVDVYPLLKPGVTINQEIDIFTKRWTVGEMQCELSNLPYYNAETGIEQRLSDEWTDLRGATVEFYLLAGTRSTQLSHCLKRWVGDIVVAATYTPELISFTAHDRIMSFFRQKLGRTLFEGGFASIFADDKDKMIPIAFGTFEEGSKGTASLLRGWRMNDDTSPEFIFADHPLFSTGDMYIRDDSSFPPFRTMESDFTIVFGPQYYTKGKQGTSDRRVELYVYPGTSDHFGFDTAVLASYEAPDALDGLLDPDDTTYVDVQDTEDNGGAGRTSQLLLQFNIPYLTNNGMELASFVDMEAHPDVSPTTPPFTVTAKIIDKEVFGGSPATTVVDSQSVTAGTPSTPTFFDYEPSYPFTSKVIALLIQAVYNSVAGNGTDNDQNIMRVYRANIVARTYLPQYREAFCSGEGAVYGAWIEAVGRTNGLSSGDMIDRPVFIIEYILHGMINQPGTAVDADLIDYDAFDAADAADTDAIRHRIQILSPIEPADLIRQVCEQSMLVFFISNLGEARVLNLADDDPVIVRTIELSHIIEGADGISITKSDYIVNQMDASNNYRADIDANDSAQTFTNTDSQELFGNGDAEKGIFRWKGSLPFLDDANAAVLGALLVENDNAMLAFEHIIIEFSTYGHINADLEVGDYVQFNHIYFDAQLKLFGESWEDRTFLIIKCEQQADILTRLRLVEVHPPDGNEVFDVGVVATITFTVVAPSISGSFDVGVVGTITLTVVPPSIEYGLADAPVSITFSVVAPTVDYTFDVGVVATMTMTVVAPAFDISFSPGVIATITMTVGSPSISIDLAAVIDMQLIGIAPVITPSGGTSDHHWTNRGAYRLLATVLLGELPGTFSFPLFTSATTPTVDTNVKADLTEIATGNGYSSNGPTKARSSGGWDTVNQDNTNDRANIDTNGDPTVTASGGSVPASGGAARYSGLRASNNDMITYIDLGADKSVTTGNTISIAGNPYLLRLTSTGSTQYATNEGLARFLGNFVRADSLGITSGYNIRLATSATAPDKDMTAFGTMTQITTGNGWTGPVLLPSTALDTSGWQTLTEDDSANYAYLDMMLVQIVASGGAIPASGSAIRYIIITDDAASAPGSNAFFVIDLGADMTIPDGWTFNFNMRVRAIPS